jgi:hypothetical protein
MRGFIASLLLLVSAATGASAQVPAAPAANSPELPPLKISPLAEKKVRALPPAPLFWRIENLPTLSAAQAAASDWTLAFEAEGKVWLFTLGTAGGKTPGATKIADVGPIAPVAADEYLLRVNLASGPPGSMTPVHKHPGSEAYFVLVGEQSIRTPHGTMRVMAGQPEPGHGAEMVMQVSSSGSRDLRSLVMFVVDASKPFTIPATFPP